jgi:hypothetical protein
MLMCKDPALSYLNSLGYNVIRHPRAAISPLYLMGRRSGVNEGLGPLPRLIKSDAATARPRPRVSQKEASAGIEGKTTGQLAVGVGLGILKGFLKGIGVEVDIDVDAQFGSAHKLQFSFSKVLVERVEPLDIGTFLSGARADLDNPVVRGYLQGGGKLYVLHEVIKSAQISVLFDSSSREDLTLKLPLLQKSVAGKATVGLKADKELALSFTGTEPLAFGFKCLQIWLGERDGQVVFETTPAAPGPRLHLGVPAQSGSGPLLIKDELVELTDAEESGASAPPPA